MWNESSPQGELYETLLSFLYKIFLKLLDQAFKIEIYLFSFECPSK